MALGQFTSNKKYCLIHYYFNVLIRIKVNPIDACKVALLLFQSEYSNLKKTAIKMK